ncbi:MAG: putative DNA binding domain-containing protein [Fibrobacter sp.]|nr:putative DNA binding domain-containing protein [Fibrobacter sp.]
MTIDEILSMEESQTFDRKSINIAPRDFSNHICAFANADGGIIVIGISDKTKRIEGVDHKERQVNELLRVPMDFCIPTVPFAHEFVECVDSNGKPNHVLVFRIEASPLVHENQAHDAYLRVGDKSKTLPYEDRLTLSFDKGLRSFEDILLPESCYEDIDEPYLKKYLEMIGYSKDPREYLLKNKNYAKIKDGEVRLSVAAILLFGKNPQQFFPRARVRFIRYEGTEEKFGTEMNVIKDVIFEGRILEQIQQTVAYIQTQIKERTYLTKGGIFTTEQEYPEFVRTELVVNAVTHRDYSIRGTEIQIKMFDNHLVVESPGNLPSQIKIEKIRNAHFARNSHIAEYLKDYKYVKDFGEGVDRMCREMESLGLPVPEYRQDSFILKATVKNVGFATKNLGIDPKNLGIDPKNLGIDFKNLGIERIKAEISSANLNATTRTKLLKIAERIDFNQVFGAKDLINELKCSPPTATELIKKLKSLNLIVQIKGVGKGKYVFYNMNTDDEK